MPYASVVLMSTGNPSTGQEKMGKLRGCIRSQMIAARNELFWNIERQSVHENTS